jgi:hypothetical protein
MIYGIFIMLLPLLFGVLEYFTPSFQFPNLIGYGAALSLEGPLGLYISRSIAAAVAMAFALAIGSPRAILTMFVLRFVTDVLDFFHILVTGGPIYPSIISWIVIFWVPTLLAIRILWPRDEPAK